MGQDRTISQLTVADNLTGDEKLVFAKNGANGAVSAETFKAYAREGLSPKEALFIDLWNNACGSYGRYNAETGYFELNGLTDITYAQAIPIILEDKIKNNALCYYRGANKIRTHLPFHEGLSLDGTTTFYNATNLEKVCFQNLMPSDNCFKQCSALHTIEGRTRAMPTERCKDSTFVGCIALENVNLRIVDPKSAQCSLNFKDSPKISLKSWQKMITNATNTSAITITVHADVYAKLTGDTSNAAAAALTPEEATKWQQLVTDAAAKQITFATA